MLGYFGTHAHSFRSLRFKTRKLPKLAAAQAELRAARAELENLKMSRAADRAAKLELARRRTLTDATAAQRDVSKASQGS
jgi:hypothetical protein